MLLNGVKAAVPQNPLYLYSLKKYFHKNFFRQENFKFFLHDFLFFVVVIFEKFLLGFFWGFRYFFWNSAKTEAEISARFMLLCFVLLKYFWRKDFSFILFHRIYHLNGSSSFFFFLLLHTFFNGFVVWWKMRKMKNKYENCLEKFNYNKNNKRSKQRK